LYHNIFAVICSQLSKRLRAPALHHVWTKKSYLGKWLC